MTIGAARIAQYPGHNGHPNLGGLVVFEDNGVNSIKMRYSLSNFDASESGGIHVHTVEKTNAASCAEAIPGGHYFIDPANDPWLTSQKYTTDTSGNSLQAADTHIVDNFTVENISGKVVVMHNAAGVRVGCGVIIPYEDALLTTIEKYPDYAGSSDPSGLVLFTKDGPYGGLNSYGNVFGLNNGDCANSNGIHIHTGNTCATSAGPAGHLFDSDKDDFWIGNSYCVDSTGASPVDFSIQPSKSLLFEPTGDLAIASRAVVMHDINGARIGCGVTTVISGCDTPPSRPADDDSPPCDPKLSAGQKLTVEIFLITAFLGFVFFMCWRIKGGRKSSSSHKEGDGGNTEELVVDAKTESDML